jgi:ABC-type phosphate/phosphonate transport system substrate-binding protein
MVAGGAADIAAIDAVAWALFAEHEPEAFEALEVMGWTRSMPALPFITAPANAGMAPDLIAALDAACGSASGPGVPRGVMAAGAADYEPVRAMAAGLRGVRLAPGARML